MLYITIGGIVALFVFFMYIVGKQVAPSEDLINNQNKYFIENNNIEVDYHDGYEEYNIAGISFAKLGNSDLGYFVGKVVPQSSNPHDKNAIEVVRKDGRHLGWISKDDNKGLKKAIGGKEAYSYGYVAMFRNDDNELAYYGRVFVRVDESVNEEVCHLEA